MAVFPKPHIVGASVLIDLEHGGLIEEIICLARLVDAGYGDRGGDEAVELALNQSWFQKVYMMGKLENGCGLFFNICIGFFNNCVCVFF